MQELPIDFTLENGIATYNQFIEGKLDSIIVISTNKCSVTLQSQYGYTLFHTSEHEGSKYYAPRAVLQKSQAHLTTQAQFDKFSVNEELELTVQGQDKEMQVILRFE